MITKHRLKPLVVLTVRFVAGVLKEERAQIDAVQHRLAQRSAGDRRRRGYPDESPDGRSNHAAAVTKGIVAYLRQQTSTH
ncbi:MAG: hypothetical protein JO106_14240 [Mycobacterium sp.]|nr:hypothetical protein [Mycobacterium sp.]